MIDLHMHSFFSEDGEMKPEELIRKCAALGMSMMSITDHNCVKANETAMRAAHALGIAYIPGTEIDCMYKGTGFHVLGYGIDYRSSDYEKIERDVREQGLRASLERLEKTQLLGFHVTEDEMWQKSKDTYWEESWTGDLFAEVILAKPEYAGHPLLRPYREGGGRSDNPYVNFYWDFYSQGKLCYVEMSYPPMEEVIRIIHGSGGKAVLAHPGVSLKGKETFLEGILDLGIDGIEAFSSYHNPAECFHYYHEAKRRGLFVTCGSDYHGKTKPSVFLGKNGCMLSDEEIAGQMPFFDIAKSQGKSMMTIRRTVASRMAHQTSDYNLIASIPGHSAEVDRLHISTISPAPRKRRN
jgi:predicted metal-dependent phosphoesterase TrpH